MPIDTIPEVLPGEGDEEIIKRTRVRIACDECEEDAVYRHTYLLPNARRNPASSAYQHDDCSWCSDHEVFTCKTCKRPNIDGYEWCSTFTASVRFAHLFLKWKEEKVKA